MTTKTRTRSRSSSTSKRGKTNIEQMFRAAAQAAQELGEAAKAAQQSWDHVHKARSKANPVITKATRAGKKAFKTAKRVVIRSR